MCVKKLRRIFQLQLMAIFLLKQQDCYLLSRKSWLLLLYWSLSNEIKDYWVRRRRKNEWKNINISNVLYTYVRLGSVHPLLMHCCIATSQADSDNLDKRIKKCNFAYKDDDGINKFALLTRFTCAELFCMFKLI